MLKILLILSVFFILVWTSEWLLRKRLKINKEKVYRYINSTHKNIEISLIVIFLFILFFTERIFPILLILLILLTLIRAFYEWKYEKEKREYFMTLISVIIYPTFLGITFYLANMWNVFGK